MLKKVKRLNYNKSPSKKAHFQYLLYFTAIP